MDEVFVTGMNTGCVVIPFDQQNVGVACMRPPFSYALLDEVAHVLHPGHAVKPFIFVQFIKVFYSGEK